MTPHNTWDLIIVGAGSSGAALAGRSVALGKRVLLLEGGPDYRSAEMPEVWRSPNPLRALLDPHATDAFVWKGLNAARTDAQPSSLYWRGRGVGGSSAINGQIAIRPPVEDFEDWAKQGCEGWSPADVLPYFSKLEDDEQFGDEDYHGNDGPIPIYRTPEESWGSVDAALKASATEAGMPWAEDLNAPGATGVSPYPINSREGRRVTTNDAYLEPARTDDNLTIIGNAVVDRVIFAAGRAIGVSAIVDGTEKTFQGGQIVLSAGTVHTPTILMRSGIGPAAMLKASGVRPRIDLPVGLGLQDHPVVFVGIPLREGAAVKSPDERHTNVAARYTSDDPASQFNDMLIMAANQNVLAMERADITFGAGAFGVWVNQVYSTGSVELVSSNPLEQPFVRQRMLSDARDLSRMRQGIRFVVDLTRSAAVDQIRLKTSETLNEAVLAVLDDDEKLDAFLLASAADAQHATSTCRMGSAGDPAAVVGPDCAVYGTEGLFVVDASIFPTVPRANTNLIAIMAGELMADRLR